MKIKLLSILLIVAFFISCSDSQKQKPEEDQKDKIEQIPFDEEKWKIKKGLDYPHRTNMLEDVLWNDRIRGAKQDEIIEILGPPTKIDNMHLFYRISQTRLKLWPLTTKTMVIQLSPDSTVNWIKVHG